MSKMNKPLANYYHEARAQVKKLKTMQEENKKRAERRAEIIAPVAADPLQNLFISGTSCKVLRGAESHAMNEAGENLVPWNGQQDNMIDRFDVRALLDFYKEPDPRVLAARQKSNEALKLEQTLRFESYRDLVRLAARGLSEAQGLATVDAESLDRRAAQHAALQAATDAVYFNPKPGAAGGPGTAAHGATPAGSGVYSAMGFSYDASAGGPARAAGAAATPAAAAAAAVSSDSSSDDESDDDSEDEAALAGRGAGGLAGPVSEADLAQEAEDERVDDMAEAYGLADFSYRLHRSLEKEGEEEARMRKRPKKNMSRKKAANRAKRMTGMGLDPSTGLPLHQHNPYKDPRALINPWQDSRAAGNASPDRPHHRRSSPDYEAGGWRVRERSPTPPRPGEKQYITEFVSSDAAGAAGDDFMGGSNSARPGIIEALPDRPDPAMLGGIQPVARGFMTLQGIK
ncbi:alternative splicing regulator-domain-containing protein [Scenedesmus sp. NREL 46B-D3]|nr:alternative splicing regulator-domain-containing protein [Scenedesmus sp. NREL 46B-D3]